MYSLNKRLTAEAFGTFWLVLAGCGSAVISAQSPSGGIGLLGVSLAFGLSVLTVAYALGHISGAHLNPAVTVGLATAKRFPLREVLPYLFAQILGAIAASLLLYFIASGSHGFQLANGFATNGYGTRSPGGYDLGACLASEVTMTFMFLTVILGVTGRNAPKSSAPIAIGLCLTLIHLITIPITNTSVNPARSTGPALIVGASAISQLWLFWLAPILGAIAAGAVHRAWHSRGVELTSVDKAA